MTAFGLDLYREMLAEPELALGGKNIVFSPTSIALALGMARAGAKGETGSQIDAVLHTTGQSELEAGLNALDQALASRDGTYEDSGGASHELTVRIANASFAQRGWSIVPSYLDTIAAAFGAGLNLVDYAKDPDAARKTINGWVSDKTAQRIPELLGPSSVTSGTRLYRVNAIYLKANWVAPFTKARRCQRVQVASDGSSVMAPTMRLAGGQEVPYLRGEDWQATELRYLGPDNTTPLAMMLIMPDDLASFESSVSAGQLGQIATDLSAERKRLNDSIEQTSSAQDCGTYPYSLDLRMPRFTMETRAELQAALEALGMPLAFDAADADFTAIHVLESAGDPHLCLERHPPGKHRRGRNWNGGRGGHRRRFRHDRGTVPGTQAGRDRHASPGSSVPLRPARHRDRRDPVHGPRRRPGCGALRIMSNTTSLGAATSVSNR